MLGVIKGNTRSGDYGSYGSLTFFCGSLCPMCPYGCVYEGGYVLAVYTSTMVVRGGINLKCRLVY